MGTSEIQHQSPKSNNQLFLKQLRCIVIFIGNKYLGGYYNTKIYLSNVPLLASNKILVERNWNELQLIFKF